MSGLRPPYTTIGEDLTKEILGKRLSKCQEENERLQKAVNAFRDLLMEVRGSPKGSMGSINNVYCPHPMRCTRIDAIWNKHFQNTEDTHA